MSFSFEVGVGLDSGDFIDISFCLMNIVSSNHTYLTDSGAVADMRVPVDSTGAVVVHDSFIE